LCSFIFILYGLFRSAKYLSSLSNISIKSFRSS
jgi:hypothetical protein